MRYFRVLPVLEITEKKATKTNPHYVRKPNTKHSDELVLAIRTAHEIDRKTTRQVEKMFPQVNKQYIYNILNYTIRANIRPKPLKE